MRRFILTYLVALFCIAVVPATALADNESTKKERNAITAGNKLYNDGRSRAAIGKYEEALRENPNSAVGRYNLGLSQIRVGTNPSDTTQAAKDLAAKGCQALEQIAKMGSMKPRLASMANYNLGNVAFNSEDYSKALGYYKQALRLNPNDDKARRNLRITQLKIQDQDNQDQDKDKEEDQKDKEQNQDQQQNQNQNQDQNQDKQDQQNNQQQQPKPQDINQQTADQILKAMENKENQTRARVATGNQGDKSKGRNRNNKNW